MGEENFTFLQSLILLTLNVSPNKINMRLEIGVQDLLFVLEKRKTSHKSLISKYCGKITTTHRK